MAPTGLSFIKPKPAAIQLLEKQLTSADAGVRHSGVETIPKLNAPVEPLTDCVAACMEHQNWFVRRTASEACCASIQAKGAAEVAIKGVAGTRMSHKDREVLRCAKEALVSVVDTVTAPENAGRLQPALAELAASEAARRLEDPDYRARQNAVEALSRMGPIAKPHMLALAARLADVDLSVRNAAVRAFSLLGVTAAGGAEVAAKQLTSQDERLRRTAAKALLALAPHSGPAAAAAAVAQLGCPDAVGRRAVMLCMVDLGPLMAPHGEALAAMLEDQDIGVRTAVVKVLLSAGPTVAPCLKFVRKRLAHKNKEVRRAAVDTMRAMCPMCPTFAQAAGKILREDQTGSTQDSIRERAAALTILGGAGANAEPYLEDIANELGATDWAVRRAAIESLEDLGEVAAKVAQVVARHLLHQEPENRRAAAEALGRMGLNAGPYASRVETMIDSEEDEDVRKACEEAVARLIEAGALRASSKLLRPPEQPPS